MSTFVLFYLRYNRQNINRLCDQMIGAILMRGLRTIDPSREHAADTKRPLFLVFFFLLFCVRLLRKKQKTKTKSERFTAGNRLAAKTRIPRERLFAPVRRERYPWIIARIIRPSPFVRFFDGPLNRVGNARRPFGRGTTISVGGSGGDGGGG